MMPNKNKQKGSRWEKEAVDYLNERVTKSKWKRVPGSGAMGTNMGEPLLQADIVGEVEGFNKKFRVECKSGYNYGSKEVKQLTVKKDWLDKVQEEAGRNFAVPLLLAKFDNARTGVKKMAILNIDEFIGILNYINELKRELDLVYEKLAKEKRME